MHIIQIRASATTMVEMNARDLDEVISALDQRWGFLRKTIEGEEYSTEALSYQQSFELVDELLSLLNTARSDLR